MRHGLVALICVALICAAFIAAPVQRAFASAYLPSDVAMEMDAPSSFQNHDGDVSASSERSQCCPEDHSATMGGFCSDCLVMATLDAAVSDQMTHHPVSLLKAVSGLSLCVASEAPVPKI